MKLFDVYPLYPIELVKGKGAYVFDKNGKEILDLYGGHAVISVGHSHPHYVESIKNQLDQLGFFSNSVHLAGQEILAEKLGKISGYEDYNLFLVNSGAEANENALKVASFVTGRRKMISFSKSFHGRTSGAVSVTDNPKIIAPFNKVDENKILPFNEWSDLSEIDEQTAGVIVEGIQGVGGINVAEEEFLKALRKKCDEVGAILIFDSVQCGYGRSGKFFSHQYYQVHPDIITTAKGMGNGFPIGGVLISPKIEAYYGMLGTTFGGNPLACAAGIAVLEIIEKENLVENAFKIGNYIMNEVISIPGVNQVRGRGLMIGIDIEKPQKEVVKELLLEKNIFCGNSGSNTIRLLPSLGISEKESDIFLESLKEVLAK